MQPKSRQSFVLRHSSRWTVAYLIASYTVGAAFMVEQYVSTHHLYSDPAELLFPLAMPLVLPGLFLYGLGSFSLGIRAAVPAICMYALFALIFTASMVVLGRRSGTVA